MLLSPTDTELGRGGLCVVERVLDPDLGHPVARKRLRTRHVDDPDRESVLWAEVELLSQLDHPRIPRVRRSGRLDTGHPYFTMNLIEGSDLEQHLHGRHPARLTVNALHAACDALMHAHTHGFVHGDLKPGNLMLDRDQQTHVIDWGLGRRPGVVREPETISGTAAYMSPEQALGRPIDARTDVFNLGAILCRVLTGLPPYVGDWSDVHARAASCDLEHAFENLDRCGAPSRWVDLTRRCLAAEPDQRPADASEFADELGRSLRPSPWKRLIRRVGHSWKYR